jgi:hypothetical protein
MIDWRGWLELTTSRAKSQTGSEKATAAARITSRTELVASTTADRKPPGPRLIKPDVSSSRANARVFVVGLLGSGIDAAVHQLVEGLEKQCSDGANSRESHTNCPAGERSERRYTCDADLHVSEAVGISVLDGGASGANDFGGDARNSQGSFDQTSAESSEQRAEGRLRQAEG